MIQFLQSLVGAGQPASTRTVVGHPGSIELKDAEYLRASKTRLAALHHLYNRYKETPHALKIRAVYEKTKNIHDYLSSRDRVHELELFHIQHTEHFINTFRVIIDLHHQNHKQPKRKSNAPPRRKPRTEGFFERIASKLTGRSADAYDKVDMVKSFVSQDSPEQAAKRNYKTTIPALSVPDVLINTYAKIPYVKEDVAEGFPSKEIGYTATPQEKLDFLQYISARMPVENISYVGNAHVSIPNSRGTVSTGLVPVIHWEGFLYAINLNDYRLFPVRIYRKP